MIRRPPRSTQSRSSAASDVYKRQILDVHGFLGLRGWQWLFIIEAVPAVILGLLVLVWLPDNPASAKWMPQAERDWLQRRLVAELALTAHHRRQSVWQIMADKRVAVLGLV